MMAIDNFDLIKHNLTFRNDRSFYFVLLLKRRKENDEMEVHAEPIGSYYIFSVGDLMRRKKEIIEKCEGHRARAYIRVNCMDIEAVLLKQKQLITDVIDNKRWNYITKTLDNACEMPEIQDGFENLYLVDLDGEYAKKRHDIKALINSIEPEDNNNKIKMILPTKNGCHLLTSEFNIKQFKNTYPDVDVHNEGLTLLYYPESCG